MSKDTIKKVIIYVLLFALACGITGGLIVEAIDATIVNEAGVEVTLGFWNGFFKPLESIKLAIPAKFNSIFKVN